MCPLPRSAIFILTIQYFQVDVKYMCVPQEITYHKTTFIEFGYLGTHANILCIVPVMGQWDVKWIMAGIKLMRSQASLKSIKIRHVIASLVTHCAINSIAQIRYLFEESSLSTTLGWREFKVFFFKMIVKHNGLNCCNDFCRK